MEFTATFLHVFGWAIYLSSPLLIALALIVIILGQIVTFIEKWNKFDGFYWSFVTATTVGYGDIRPVKKLPRILSIFIAITGILFTGIILSAAVRSSSISIETHIEPSTVKAIQENIKQPQ